MALLVLGGVASATPDVDLSTLTSRDADVATTWIDAVHEHGGSMTITATIRNTSANAITSRRIYFAIESVSRETKDDKEGHDGDGKDEDDKDKKDGKGKDGRDEKDRDDKGGKDKKRDGSGDDKDGGARVWVMNATDRATDGTPLFRLDTISIAAGAAVTVDVEFKHPVPKRSSFITHLFAARSDATIAVTPYNVAYDTLPHTATGKATGLLGESLSGLGLGGTTHTAVGVFTDAWTFAGDVNYKTAGGTVTDTIGKATATVSVLGYSGIYDATAHGASGTAKGVGGEDLAAGLSLGATFTDAPGGTAQWTFAGGANYGDQSGDVAVVIGKATASITVKPYQVLFDRLAHTATGTASGVGGVNLAGLLDISATTHTDAGAFADAWTFAGDVNYESADGTVTDTIGRATAIVSVLGYSGTYDATAHGASGTATGVGGVDLAAGLSLGATFTDAPGGTAQWAFAGGANYGDQSGDVAVVIGKATASITVTPYNVTFDALPHTAIGSATGVGGVNLASLLDLSATTHSSAGIFNDAWTFAGNVNYKSASGTITDVIVNPLPSIFGTVADARTNQPISDARVTVVGLTGEVRSGASGLYGYPTPGTGRFKLQIEKTGYTYAHRFVDAKSGLDATAEPVFLLPLDSALTSIGAAGGTHTSSGGDVQVIVPAGALTQTIEVRATNTNAARQLPAPLPFLSDYTYCVNLQPELQTFGAPVTVRVRNTLGFAAGKVIPVGFYRKDADAWIHETTSTVSADGQWVVFQCQHFSWFDCNLGTLRPSRAQAPTDTEKSLFKSSDKQPACCSCSVGGGSRVMLRTGELLVEHTTPSYRTMGEDRGVTFEYTSRSADPSILLGGDYDLQPVSGSGQSQVGTLVPARHGFRARVAGVTSETFVQPTDLPNRFGFLWDGRNAQGTLLPTGLYPFTTEFSNDYAGVYANQTTFGGPLGSSTGVSARELKPLASTTSSEVLLRNEAASPFGAGWVFAGTHRILRRTDGAVVTVEGDASSSEFELGNIISTIAGNGTLGSTGDGGLGILASVNAPWGIAVGPTGEIYFAETSSSRIRKIGRDGIITTVAGSVIGFSGDGGLATLAKLNQPVGIAFGPLGDLYIADQGNGRVRRLATNGIITTVAGTGSATFSGDGGPATQAGIGFPTGIAVGPSGDIYVVANFRVRRIATGIITTIAGTGVDANSGDGGPAVQAGLRHPNDVAVDALGQVYIGCGAINQGLAENQIRRIDAAGIISRLAGGGPDTGGGEGLPAIQVRLRVPIDLEFRPPGDDNFVDPGSNLVRKIDALGILTTLTGKAGNFAYSGEGGPAASAVLRQAQAVAVGPTGSIYISDFTGVRWVEAAYRSDGEDFSRFIADAQGALTRVYPDGSQAHYDADGDQVDLVDLRGNTTLYAYQMVAGKKVLGAVTDPVGLVTSFAYAGNGRIQSLTDPCGRVTQFTVGVAGDLSRIRNPDGTARTFEYDAAHRMTAAVDAGGTRTEYQYDSFGAITRTIKAAGTAAAQTRNFQPILPTEVVNALPAGTGTEASLAPRVAPDATRALYTDATGHTAQTKTNVSGSATEATDPVGNTTKTDLTPRDLVAKLSFPRGGSVRYEYDYRGNTTKVTNDATGAVWQMLWHPYWSLPIAVTDPLGAVTKFEYDSVGNPKKVTDPAGNPATFTHDARGLPTSRTDALGHVTQFAYDARENVTGVTDAAGNHADFVYDDCGRVLSATDANGRTTGRFFDPMNLVTEIHDADGGVTRFTFAPAKGTIDPTSSEPLAVLTNLTDAAGHATTFDHDTLHRLVRETDPLGRATLFQYDGENRLVKRTDAKGQDTVYTHDAAGRLIGKDLAGPDHVTSEYDPDGNLTRLADSDSDLRMTFDAGGRLTQVATQAMAGYPATTVGYQYDLADRVVRMIDPAGGNTTYGFDTRGLPTSIVDPSSRSTTFGNDVLGRRSQMTAANGVVCAYTYDLVSNLTRIAYTKGAATVAQFDYGYDLVGNRTSMADGAGSHAYTLDSLYRLTGATHPEAFNPTEFFTYDLVGNRLSSHLSATYTYDIADELLSDATYTYGYDANGNQTSRTSRSNAADVTRYSYDGENRLTRVDFPDGGIATYRYDALGRRIEKNVRGVITRFVYDREDVLLELDGNNAVTARYTHGPWIDEPLIMDRGGAATFHVADALGSVRDLLDAQGGVTGATTYDSFGRGLAITGTPASPYTFTAREADSETGLSYVRARHLDPALGRFLQRDPLGPIGGGGNPNSYAGNNPATFVDPTGLAPESVQATVATINEILSIKEVEGNVEYAFARAKARRGVLLARGCDDPNLRNAEHYFFSAQEARKWGGVTSTRFVLGTRALLYSVAKQSEWFRDQWRTGPYRASAPSALEGLFGFLGAFK